jgi:DNA-binding response OmpR family regulator
MRLLMVDEKPPSRDSVIQLLKEEIDKFHASITGTKIMVLFLTEKDLFEGRVGEHSDYITVVHAAEFNDRMKDVLKRSREAATIQYRGIQLLGKGNFVLVDGNSIKLTIKQYMLLEYLIQNKGVILMKEQIYNLVWGYDSDTTIAIVEVFIHHLRKKLQPFGYHTEIKTVRGVGYKLNEE